MPTLLLDQGVAGPVVPVLPQVTIVPAGAVPDAVLGCGVARAEVWTKGGVTRVLDLPNITATEWTRVRSDTSEGVVQLDGVAIASDAECCAVMNTVRPWKHELHIYRDDALQWCGPIVEMPEEGGTLTIKARDVSAWLDKRFIHATHQYGGTQANQGSEDSETIFMDIVLDAFAPDTSPLGATATNPFTVINGAGYDFAQRTYTPAQFKHAGPEIRDLAKASLDWTITKRVGSVGQGASWQLVTPNPVVNPSALVDASGWTGMTRDAGVFHSTPAAFRTAGTPNAVGSIVGLDVNAKYMLRWWVRGTSSALDAAQVPNYDGVVKVGNDQSSVFSWYVYGQPTTPTFDNRGRVTWFQAATFFTATATTMPITITATGNPQDSHGIYFDDFDVMQQVPAFTLRDYSLAKPPKVTLSGLDQRNRVIAANQQSGGDYAFYAEAPKPAWTLGGFGPGLSADQAEFGLLEEISTQPLSDSTSAAGSAGNQAAALGSTPIIIDNLVLSPEAGVTMDQLIPGVMFTLRLDEPCFAVRADLILQSVSVKTTPTGGEQVTLSFQPTGF